MEHVTDLTVAHGAKYGGAVELLVVEGPELWVAALDSPLELVFLDRGKAERITITEPRPVTARDCQAIGRVHVEHAAGQGSARFHWSNVLVLGKGESAGERDAGWELMALWGPDAGGSGGLGILEGALLDLAIGGAGHTVAASQFRTPLGAYCAQLLLNPHGTTANAWARATAEDSSLDVLGGIDPNCIVPAGTVTRSWRVDVPVYIAALVNNGMVGTGAECRAHVGFILSNSAFGNQTHWPGPGLFFVTNATTRTWWAVIANQNANVANNRLTEWTEDTGISIDLPLLLRVQSGFTADGAALVQWAINGELVAEFSGKILLTMWPSFWGVSVAANWPCAGVSVVRILADNLETINLQYGFGPGMSLWRTDVPLQKGSV